MAHGYHTLQRWNTWLHGDPLGNRLLETEQQLLSLLLQQHYGKHIVLVGVPQQRSLMDASSLTIRTLISPLAHREEMPGEIESNFTNLPILTGRADLVILPHTLEFVDNPRRLLAEACRSVKPEGLIVVLGFNPLSMWGIKHVVKKKGSEHWSGNLLAAHKIKSWLALSDFQMERQQSFLYRPPIKQKQIFQKLGFVETVGKYLCPFFAGAYVIVARAKIIPLTPIRMQWKQRLGSLGFSPTVTGPLARQTENRSS